MDLSRRSALPELMDDEVLDPAVYQRCINDLAAVNRVTLTHGVTLRWLTRATKVLPLGQRLAILDIAFGHGDLLRAIAKRFAKNGVAVALSGIDLNPRSAQAAQAATPPGQKISFLTRNIFDFEPAQKFDFIVSSQFTHHLNDADVVRLLRWCEDHAQRGWFITDLHRHIIPYYGFRLLARLMFWHKIVRYDGTISIARSFRRAEWRKLLDDAGITAEIRWRFPFRYSISRVKP
jgi:2-polyprenyl-3-methyl-5-hydroxy-6-metoxy-1,4-benzoquinol methylase